MTVRAGHLRRGAARAVAAVALVAFLALVPIAHAAKAPPLAATAQYKAFVDYVKKLDGIAGQARSTAQKDKYEAELTAKRAAAAHKANALFKRGSEEAKTEFDAKSKEKAASVHGRQPFEAAMHERIDALRSQKAKTTPVAQKNAIQEQIAALIRQITAKRQELTQKRADLKAAFPGQKQPLQAAQAKREPQIAEAAEAKIAKIARHWKAAAEAKKASLNSKRESQLGYLEAKLEKGRADIASMPTVG